jgi:hypothetical protein
MTELLEQHKDIKEFMESNNPTHSQIVEAYYNRDIIMNLDMNEVFNQATKKLGLNPDEYDSLIDNRFKSEMNECIQKFLEDKSVPMEQINYEEFRNNLMDNDFRHRLEIYNTLLKYKNDRKGFYSSLSKEQLNYLGW